MQEPILTEREADALKRQTKDELIRAILGWRAECAITLRELQDAKDANARLRAERDEARARLIEAAARVERLGKAASVAADWINCLYEWEVDEIAPDIGKRELVAALLAALDGAAASCPECGMTHAPGRNSLCSL